MPKGVILPIFLSKEILLRKSREVEEMKATLLKEIDERNAAITTLEDENKMMG